MPGNTGRSNRSLWGGGSTWPDLANLAYPQIFVSPRIWTNLCSKYIQIRSSYKIIVNGNFCEKSQQNNGEVGCYFCGEGHRLTHWMPARVEAPLVSSKGCSGPMIPSELGARGSSRSVAYICRAGQRLVLAVIGSGSDNDSNPSWKNLALDGSLRL